LIYLKKVWLDPTYF